MQYTNPEVQANRDAHALLYALRNQLSGSDFGFSKNFRMRQYLDERLEEILKADAEDSTVVTA